VKEQIRKEPHQEAQCHQYLETLKGMALDIGDNKKPAISGFKRV